MKFRLAIIALCILSTGCTKEYYHSKPEDFGPPIVKMRVSPIVADSTTWITMNGAGSRDSEGMWGIIDFRWDLTGDGIWDTPYTIHPDWVYVYSQPGFYKIILEVADRFRQTARDSVEIEIYGANTDTSHFTDSRDGQVYKTVSLYGLTWMAENLNYGSCIPVSDTVKDDGQVEKYCFMDNPYLKGEFGGMYTYYDWMEMMNHDTSSVNGICPPGWEIPTSDDWRLITETEANPWTSYRPLSYFAQRGFSNLHLSRMGIHPRWQEWEAIDFSQYTEYWTYFTRDFYHGYLNGPGRNIPSIVTSKTSRTRGNIYPVQYFNDSIRKYMGIAPVRCIKRE